MSRRHHLSALLLGAALLALTEASAVAQSARRDGIADLLSRTAGEAPGRLAQKTDPAAPAPAGSSAAPTGAVARDPREGEPAYEQARRLMAAIDSVLQDTAQQRSETKKLPGKDEFVITPLWTETREDREAKVKSLLEAALGIVTDVPVVDVQKKVEGLRRNIRELEDQIVKYKEKQLVAPKDGMLPGVITDTVSSLAASIEDAQKRIEANRSEIRTAKGEIQAALQKSGVQLGAEQVDL